MLNVLDIIIISIVFVLLYKMIKNTEAFRVALGLGVIFVIYAGTSLVGLEKTAFIFEKMFEIMSVGLLVIFHPELRMMLKKLGGITNVTHREKMGIVTEIEDAVFAMSERNTGALIIFDPDKKLLALTENMIEVDAAVRKEMLETIFHMNTPLHDGAVIIQNDRIAHAGVKLPFSGKKRQGMEYAGTRHLVAVETSELLDVVCIVVSEETGRISIATNKGIVKIKSRSMFRAFFKQNEDRNLINKTKERLFTR